MLFFIILLDLCYIINFRKI